MRAEAPIVLRLPFDLVERFHLGRALAADPRLGDSRVARAGFGLRSQERDFSRRLMRRKRNLWLFRCHQQAYCGDFVIVDLSDPRPERRRAFVLELKAGERLKLDAPAGIQLARWQKAVDSVADNHGVVEAGSPARLLRGGREVVLRWLGAG